MTVEFRRGHWILFGSLLLTQSCGLWLTLNRIPDRDSIVRLLHQLPVFVLVDLIGGVVGLCFLTTVIISDLLKAVVNRR